MLKLIVYLNILSSVIFAQRLFFNEDDNNSYNNYINNNNNDGFNNINNNDGFNNINSNDGFNNINNNDGFNNSNSNDGFNNINNNDGFNNDLNNIPIDQDRVIFPDSASSPGYVDPDFSGSGNFPPPVVGFAAGQQQSETSSTVRTAFFCAWIRTLSPPSRV